MKEYRGLPGYTERDEDAEIERTDDMVGCASLVILVMLTAAVVFIGFAIFRTITGAFQ